jgi:capsular exopolysaccharide synthesis family protein
MILKTEPTQARESRSSANALTSHFAPLARKLCDDLAAVYSIGITSNDRSAGTTTVATQLAMAIAQVSGRSTLLVDANFAQPALAQQFALQQQPGLLDWLSGEVELDDCLHAAVEQRLTILPAGQLQVSSEKFDDVQMQRLLTTLRAQFDHIVVDMPIANELSSTLLLARQLDQILMVVEAGRSQADDIANSLACLRTGEAHVAGVIFNKFEADTAP